MKLEELKITDVIDVVAVVSISIALFISITFSEKDLALMLGGALGGVVGMSNKNR